MTIPKEHSFKHNIKAAIRAYFDSYDVLIDAAEDFQNTNGETLLADILFERAQSFTDLDDLVQKELTRRVQTQKEKG